LEITIFADLKEGFAKQGGQVYLSPEGPIVLSTPNVTLPTKFLFIPCLAMETVPADMQSRCLTAVDHRRPEFVVRKYQRSGRYFLEFDADYNPRSPETFEKDASFYVQSDFYFPRYYAFESVNAHQHFMQVSLAGKIEVAEFQNTKEFRDAASWTGFNHSIRCMFSQIFSYRSKLLVIIIIIIIYSFIENSTISLDKMHTRTGQKGTKCSNNCHNGKRKA